MHKRTIGIAAGVLLLAGSGVLLTADTARTQSGGAKLVIGIYTPTVNFKNSAERLNYVKGLARSVSAATGAEVEGRSYTSLADLKKANPDFAILDAQCYATNMGRWELLARARVDGGNMRTWALYSSAGPNLGALEGKKLAYVKMGCSDNAFIYNAMLESEVGQKGYFSGLVGKPDLSGAVAEVASYKGAQGVFAPVGEHKGLTKVLDTGSIPTPAFVAMNSKLSKDVVDKTAKAVRGYGGEGAISGWTAPDDGPYKNLKRDMGKRVLRPVFAEPSPVRVEARDVIVTPATLDDAALTEIKQHFEAPPERL